MLSSSVAYTLRTAVFILFSIFFFNDTATTEIYTLSLHDALPIYHHGKEHETITNKGPLKELVNELLARLLAFSHLHRDRSEEHTSELQSRPHIVCRLLLEKKIQQSNAIPALPLLLRDGQAWILHA